MRLKCYHYFDTVNLQPSYLFGFELRYSQFKIENSKFILRNRKFF